MKKVVKVQMLQRLLNMRCGGIFGFVRVKERERRKSTAQTKKTICRRCWTRRTPTALFFVKPQLFFISHIP